jgi:hypothetical protein
MEKELSAIERRATVTESKAEEKRDEHSEVLPQAESGADLHDDMPIVKTLAEGQPKFGLLSIGTEVMRQFDSGLFHGTVRSYDKKEDLYKIDFSDGDVEDFDKEEFIYAYELAINHGDHGNETEREEEQYSSEEESEYVLPKVMVVLHLILSHPFPSHDFFLIHPDSQKKKATTSTKRKRSTPSKTAKDKSSLTACISDSLHHQDHE